MHHVALGEKEFGEISPVLPGNSGNERSFTRNGWYVHQNFPLFVLGTIRHVYKRPRSGGCRPHRDSCLSEPQRSLVGSFRDLLGGGWSRMGRSGLWTVKALPSCPSSVRAFSVRWELVRRRNGNYHKTPSGYSRGVQPVSFQQLDKKSRFAHTTTPARVGEATWHVSQACKVCGYPAIAPT